MCAATYSRQGTGGKELEHTNTTTGAFWIDNTVHVLVDTRGLCQCQPCGHLIDVLKAECVRPGSV